MHCLFDYVAFLQLISYRPQKILIPNQQSDNAGRAGCHGELLLLCNLGPKAFEHEDVGCHDNRHVVECHLILGLVLNHTLEKLHQHLQNGNRCPMVY